VLSEDWKKILIEVLTKLAIIKPDFTGKVELNINEGGITCVNKTESLR